MRTLSPLVCLSATLIAGCASVQRAVERGTAQAAAREAADRDARRTRYAADPETTLAFTAVASGFHHTCGITTSGDAFCWGANEQGQLGTGGFDAYNVGHPRPLQVRTNLKFTAIAAGTEHSCAIATDRLVYCWGGGEHDALGGGGGLGGSHGREVCSGRERCSTTPMRINSTASYTALAARGYATCGLVDAHIVECWGTIAEDPPGRVQRDMERAQPRSVADSRGAGLRRASPYPVEDRGGHGMFGPAVTVGTHHACAISQPNPEIGSPVLCWGLNDNGQLGGAGGSRSAAAVEVRVPGNVTALAAGDISSCALLDSGAIWCWGRSPRYETGTWRVPTGDIAFTGGLTAGTGHVCALAGSAAYCWGSAVDLAAGGGPSRQAPERVSEKLAFRALSAGHEHTCGVGLDGALFCWGSNEFGQLGVPPGEERCRHVQEEFACTVRPQRVAGPR